VGGWVIGRRVWMGGVLRAPSRLIPLNAPSPAAVQGISYWDSNEGFGTLTRLVIDTVAGTVTQHRLMDRACEFPSVAPAGGGRAVLWVAGPGPACCRRADGLGGQAAARAGCRHLVAQPTCTDVASAPTARLA
jgi:hypothetical protein